MELVKVKLRQIGNSVGFILPQRIVRERKLKKGDEVEVEVIKREKLSFEDLFGIAKGTRPFVREHDHRD